MLGSPLRLPLAFTPALLACSLTVARPDACSRDIDCRDGFGWGSTCSEDGLCAPPNPPPRCPITLPEDLFERPAAYAERIMLGALYDPVVHRDSYQATVLAVEEVNAAGGLDEQNFALVLCDYGERNDDDLTTEEAAAENARWLAETLGVSAVLGPRGSSRAKATFEAFGGKDIVLVTPSATSPELTEIDEVAPSDEMPGLLWRTVPPDGFQARVLVDDMIARDVGSVGVIAQIGSYGDDLAALISELFVDGQVSVFPYDTSLFGALADAAAGGAEEIVVISSDIGDYVAFLDGAVSSSGLLAYYDSVGIFLPDAARSVQLFAVQPEAHVLFDNIRGSRPAPAEGTVFQTFEAAYGSRFGENPESSGFTVHSYDAAWLVFYAHAWARYNEANEGGRALARGLRRLSDKAAGQSVLVRPSSWATARDEFAAGRAIDVMGGSGDLDYDPLTEETTAPIEIWGIEEVSPGQFDFVRIEIVG